MLTVNFPKQNPDYNFHPCDQHALNNGAWCVFIIQPGARILKSYNYESPKSQFCYMNFFYSSSPIYKVCEYVLQRTTMKTSNLILNLLSCLIKRIYLLIWGFQYLPSLWGNVLTVTVQHAVCNYWVMVIQKSVVDNFCSVNTRKQYDTFDCLHCGKTNGDETLY